MRTIGLWIGALSVLCVVLSFTTWRTSLYVTSRWPSQAGSRAEKTVVVLRQWAGLCYRLCGIAIRAEQGRQMNPHYYWMHTITNLNTTNVRWVDTQIYERRDVQAVTLRTHRHFLKFCVEWGGTWRALNLHNLTGNLPMCPFRCSCLRVNKQSKGCDWNWSRQFLCLGGCSSPPACYDITTNAGMRGVWLERGSGWTRF